MSIKQTASFISTYASDVSGVCSALFELGGMCVMHDASGCNSTYNTHDEPRWYDMDSMVYITGLSEMEAIMGDDSKMINDIVIAAKQLRPNFIAIAATPIPMMVGTDIKAIAKVIENQIDIPTFGFNTNGMHSYILGASKAYEILVQRLVIKKNMIDSDIHNKNIPNKNDKRINILGATPLDFSVNGNIEAITTSLINEGFEITSCWTMNSSMEQIINSANASANLVISYSGLAAAKEMKKLYDIPYVLGVPIGGMKNKVYEALSKAIVTRENQISYQQINNIDCKKEIEYMIIGEGIYSSSLAASLYIDYGIIAGVICTVNDDTTVLIHGGVCALDEEDIVPYLSNVKCVIADPLYKPIIPNTVKHIELPHEAFSGRIYRNQIPDMTTNNYVLY